MQQSYVQLGEQQEDLTIIGLDAPVEVRRHPTARRLTLRVSPTKRTIILTLPNTCNLEEAGTFVVNNLDWLQERLAALPEARPFDDGVEIPLRGRSHRIKFVDTNRRGQIVWVEKASYGNGKVSGGRYGSNKQGKSDIICVSGRVEHAPRRLRDWLVSEARDDLSQRVAWHAKNLQLKPRRIAVRDQSTRWGSCSSSGVLSFSWRLILAPVHVLDYVAAHEVAHLEEMNHGPRFWELVRITMPRMEEAQDWLRRRGSGLHCFGANDPN